MTKLAYKVNFLGTQSEDGVADRLVFTDSLSILTVQAGHAPLISILQSGGFEVKDGESSKAYTYQSGLLRVDGERCTVTILS
ncbi:hypothetical protein EBR57_05410 [bacterium]|nr:hypothetical protein [bacterium]